MDAERRRRELDVALLVVKRDLDLLVRGIDAVKLVDEVHVPGGATELAVGRGLQANLFLHADRVADRVVLGRPQLRGRDPVLREVLACLEKLGRSKQAPHVVGPERGRRALAHVFPPSSAMTSRKIANARFAAGTPQ